MPPENVKTSSEKEKAIEEWKRSMKEFDLAWKEFFKDKPRPKNDEEDRKQQEEFLYWYNNVRKQSDTGKTPKEMGERIMNMDWDEDSTDIDMRPCPECGNFEMEVTADVNTYECHACESVWQRLKPLNDREGNMINMPEKLKNLLKRE